MHGKWADILQLTCHPNVIVLQVLRGGQLSGIMMKPSNDLHCRNKRWVNETSSPRKHSLGHGCSFAEPSHFGAGTCCYGTANRAFDHAGDPV
jgi:hypothetical protein